MIQRAARVLTCRSSRKSQGFTLIEMLVVLAIIAIIAVAAIPDRSAAVIQLQVKESMDILVPIQGRVAEYYAITGAFPASNISLALPAADKIIGNYLAGVELAAGALQMSFGNKAHPKLQGLRLTLRPVYVPGSPQSPVSWICGQDSVPTGMLAAGVDQTSIPAHLLPIRCR